MGNSSSKRRALTTRVSVTDLSENTPALSTRGDLAACLAQQGVEQRARLQGAADADTDDLPLCYTHYLRDESAWQALCAVPDTSAIARTEVVKVIFDREHESVDLADHFFFLESGEWPWHYRFLQALVFTDEERQSRDLGSGYTFNHTQYFSPDRRYILFTLVRYENVPGKVVLELFAGDDLKPVLLAQLLEAMRHVVFFGDQLVYRPLSPLHEELVAAASPEVRAGIPLISTEEVYGGVRYQSLNVGRAFGRLLLLDDDAELETLSGEVLRSSVVVCRGVPVDLPPVVGLVTACLQTPLCHVALLCANRGTPNMALVGAHEEAQFAELAGKPVRLTVKRDEFELVGLSEEEYEAERESHREKKKRAKAHIKLQPRLDEVQIMRVMELNDSHLQVMGAKAYNLACLYRVNLGPRAVLLEGLAVPFAHYAQHLEAAVGEPVGDTLARASNEEERKAAVARIHEAVSSRAVNPELVEALMSVCKKWDARRVIVRSSTNVEDLPRFNGAGLYASVPAVKDDEADMASAICKVWSSLWTWKAYSERELFGIDESGVAAGLLVMPFLEEEHVHCNGVAITANPFRSNLEASYVNLQAGSRLVTDGEGTPEQVLLYEVQEPEPSVEVIARSSLLPPGSPLLLSRADASMLHKVLRRVHMTLYSSLAESGGNCFDLEFFLLKDGGRRGDKHRVVFVQCRPFTVRFYQEWST